MDSNVIETSVDASDAQSFTCPGFDHGTCCDGSFCNGFCTQNNDCYCGGEISCPAATRCCYDSKSYGCRLPSECLTCDAVGKGAGIENCCDPPPSEKYCRGVCGIAGDPYYWCTCGDAYGGCEHAPYPDAVCCPYTDGGMRCVPGTMCP
jgi:hypothetical protein